jgi:probable HAF family extracellular repeat protein
MTSRLLGAALALTLLSGPALAGPYTLTFIGLADGANEASAAFAVNNAGQVVGSDINLSASLGFIWQNGAATPTLPASSTFNSGNSPSFVQAINAHGQVAGYGRVAFGVDHAFRQTGGAILDLGDLPLGGDVSKGWGINANGWVVGESGTRENSLNVQHGFVWNGSTMLDAGDLAGGANASSLRAINDSNVAVGWGTLNGSNRRAIKWEAGVLTDLGELPGGNDSSEAYAINNAGVIVGQSALLGPANISVVHAVRWDGGVMTELGELPGGADFSTAFGFNEAGDIVGRSRDGTGDRAVLWRNNVLHDINDLVPDRGSFTFEIAYDINDNGWIVGMGYDAAADRDRAFVLIPQAGQETATPEPASAVLLLSGLVALLRRRARA